MNVPESHTRQRTTKARHAHRAALSALHTLTDCLDAGRANHLDSYVLRETEPMLERYCELTLAVAEISDAGGEDYVSFALGRLTALQRLAGRRDAADLECAARCLARVSARRLREHARGARADLSRACAALRDLVALSVSRADDETRRTSSHAPLRSTCEALLDFLLRVAELASHLDDNLTVGEINRLVDAECAHLREANARHHNFSPIANESRDISRPAPERIAHR